MKNHYPLYVIILWLLIGCSQSEEIHYSYSVTEIFSEISLSDEHHLYVDETGEPVHGTYTASYPDGALRADITFRDGMISEGRILRPDGIKFTDYTLEDQRIKHTNYIDGRQIRMVTVYGSDLSDRKEFRVWTDDGIQIVESNESIFKLWFENGQLSMEVPAVDGETHGTVRSWHKNGHPKAEYHFTEGVRNGTSTDWDEKGNVIKKETYKHGDLVSEGEGA